MITIRVDAAGLAARLAGKARRYARARIEARTAGDRRWRRARWLWPLMAKER